MTRRSQQDDELVHKYPSQKEHSRHQSSEVGTSSEASRNRKNNSHPNRWEVISHCGFDMQFLMITDIENIFMNSLAICMSSLEKCSVPVGKDVEKLKHLYTIGGNAKWFSHSEKQYACSSKH